MTDSVIFVLLLGVALACGLATVIERNRASAEWAEERTRLDARIEELVTEVATWLALAGPMWVGDESQGHFVCLACNQPGADDGGCKTIRHLPDCEYAAALAAEEKKP